MIVPTESKYLPKLGVNVVPIPLRRSDPSSPWCYAVNLTPTIPIYDDDTTPSSPSSQSTNTLPPNSNFLATQVWPSSRTASSVIERHMHPSWTVCELGCGPGLPSLTAAKRGAARVIATDVDELALGLVRVAAVEQGFVLDEEDENDSGVNTQQRFSTEKFDLTSNDAALPEADLYILSDVFESSAVAEGAARHVSSLISSDARMRVSEMSESKISRVWVFAQADRAQRDSFRRELIKRNNGETIPDWTSNHDPCLDAKLWLFDLDEQTVEYN